MTTRTPLTPPLVLVGLPGAGKSKAGHGLASALGLPHVDTDAMVEAEQGRPIREIFATDGEDTFRALEADAVERALGMRAVVSLGGGAVTTPRVRDLLAGHAVVLIDVAHEELVRRTSRKTHRPLLRDDPDGTLRRLREERMPLYEQVAALRVASGVGPVTEVIDEILSHVAGAPRVVRVSGEDPYDVLIGTALPESLITSVRRAAATKALIIHPEVLADRAASLVEGLAAEGIEARTLAHPAGEEGKSLAFCERAWREAGTMRLGRADLVVGLGGGATTDVAGFVAATWLRGVDVVQVPTTLLGMVDAAVGGKTGINTETGKNLVGSFHPPVRVVEDLSVLRTLPEADLRAGLGEVVKCGFIRDGAILDLVREDPAACADPSSPVLAELVRRSVAVKAEVVSADLKEGGLREILNYGHTLAHAIERCEDYRVRHGEAVAAGCVFAAELAAELGLLDEAAVAAHREAFTAVGLPTSWGGAPWEEVLGVMTADKKARAGQLRFVLLDGIGHPVVRVVSPEALVGPARKVGIDV